MLAYYQFNILYSNTVAVVSIRRDSRKRIKAKLENVYLTFYACWPEDIPLNLSFTKEKKIVFTYVVPTRYTILVYSVVMDYGKFHDIYMFKMNWDKQSYKRYC